MGGIQKLYALNQHIYDNIQDFINGNYNAVEILAIKVGKST